LDVASGGREGLEVAVDSGPGAGVAARMFSTIKEAPRIRVITSTAKSMLFFNSTLFFVMFLLHPP
jgi:hypothetical protein